MAEPELSSFAQRPFESLTEQTGICTPSQQISVDAVEDPLSESRSATATPGAGDNGVEALPNGASVTESCPAATKKKKKSKKKKNKSQKALAIGSGFEEYYADNPVRPEEWAEERKEYDPIKHSFRERIDACLLRYKKKRFLDKHRARIFQVYLSFAKIYKPKAENQKFAGEGQSDDEDGNEDDNQRTQKTAVGGYDEVLDAEDWSLRSKKFFAHHIPFELFLTKEGPLLEAITVVENFVRYLLFHEVCPEFTPALQYTLEISNISRRELPAAIKLINILPGQFNTAFSFLLGGEFGHHNPSLPKPIYDPLLELEVDYDMVGGTGDAVPIVVPTDVTEAIEEDRVQEVTSETEIEAKSQEPEIKLEFKNELDKSDIANLPDDDDGGSAAELDRSSRPAAAVVQIEDVTEGSDGVDPDNWTDKKEPVSQEPPPVPIQESFEIWQKTAPKVEFDQHIEWTEDKEFEERMNPTTEEPWDEIPVQSAYDFRMTETEARRTVARVLFKDLNDQQLQNAGSLCYIYEYSLPVEVVDIHLPHDTDENALGQMEVVPWWHILEDESAPDDCPFPENEKITLLLERKALEHVFMGMKLEAKLKRLSDRSFERFEDKGTVVFDYVTRIMCSFYVNSSPTGD
ncbi:Argonaute siRNA chaperone complex subunit Arb1-domain-containing protein [Lipomyces orientalis]|uniref:Argonaute siRNA chaperone complex subunit Arb1-domain-containing protein n=1 Tax=Lipomyces orientalis TaxID=1233043 RepID=A0ACC3TS08_9ASCO